METGIRQAKMQNQAARKPKRKPESRIPSGVATVVTLKIDASMHDAKARVHRSKIGHYGQVDLRKETRLENTENGEKTKIKQFRSRHLVY